MSKYAFGVDVGGTTVKLGLFNDKGQVLDKWEIPTVKDNGGEKVLPDIAASIKNKMQEKNISVEELVGVGIGAPGAVDADGYMVNGAVNIGLTRPSPIIRHPELPVKKTRITKSM